MVKMNKYLRLCIRVHVDQMDFLYSQLDYQLEYVLWPFHFQVPTLQCIEHLVSIKLVHEPLFDLTYLGVRIFIEEKSKYDIRDPILISRICQVNMKRLIAI